jgi:hypothetical protein
MHNSQLYHSLSKLLSTAVFRRMIVEGQGDYFRKEANKYDKELGLNANSTNRDAIRAIYQLLDKNYRFEYMYKNRLLNKLIDERKLTETTVLNELRVGMSIADTIIINGEPVLYEVKTELDSPQKLYSQISDYEKAFGKIFIVTHESVYYRYYQLLKGTDIGLMYLSNKNDLIVHKPASINLTRLDCTTLFKLLRKNEYTEIVSGLAGDLAKIPNTLYFRHCLQLASSLPVADLYKKVFEQLKARKNTPYTFLESGKTPKELRYLCYTLDFNKIDFQNLHAFLKSPYKS